MARSLRSWLSVVILLAAAPVLVATAWVGGKGQGSAGAYLSAAFPPSPALHWKSFRGDAVVGSAPSNALFAGKHVIVAFGTRLLAVSADTGEPAWKRDLPAPPVGDLLWLDDQVIVTLPTGKIFACHPADGAVIWEKTCSGKVVNSPAFTDEVFTLATDNSKIDVLARKTGATVASVSVRGDIEAPPLQMGKSILLALRNGSLMRVEGGANRWSATLPKGVIRQPVVTNGQQVLVTTDDTIYSLNLSSVSAPFRWSYTCPDLLGTPALAGNTVYFATTTGQLRAIDTFAGRNRWGERGIALPAPAVAPPLVIGDHLFLRMAFGLIGLFAKENGELVWSYRIPASPGSLAADPVAGAPVVAGNDLYFGASDGAVYRLSADMSDLDPPVFRKVLPTMAGSDFSPARPLEFVGAVVEDVGSGVQPGSVTLTLDGVDLTAKLHYDIKTGYHFAWLTPAQTPTPGMHRLLMTAKDRRGNEGVFAATFYVGNAATSERVPVAINTDFLPRHLKVRPGAIIEWVNQAGSPRTVSADRGTFTSDQQFPTGIPHGERWVWVVPDTIAAGTRIAYHCRFYGEAGTEQTPGPGLTGVIEIVDPRRDLPGLPKAAPAALPTFPTPDFLK